MILWLSVFGVVLVISCAVAWSARQSTSSGDFHARGFGRDDSPSDQLGL